MGRVSGLLLCCALTACVSARSHVRYVPAEEAAWFKFGDDLPEESRVELSGTRTAAMQLAMEHFLPWNVRSPAGAGRSDICVHQRQSWDVETAPGEEGIMWVRFSLSPGACYRWGPPMDMEFTYAVDMRSGRLLERDPMKPPPELPRQGRLRLEGNLAAAIQLALEDFLPRTSAPRRPASTSATPTPSRRLRVRRASCRSASPSMTRSARRMRCGARRTLWPAWTGLSMQWISVRCAFSPLAIMLT
jgi:hypothetical protein